MCRLFTEMPHLQIKHFSQMDVNDLFRLTEHGLKVFRGVNGFINAVKTENDEQLVARIHRITRSHFDRGIIAREDFEVRPLFWDRSQNVHNPLNNKKSCF